MSKRTFPMAVLAGTILFMVFDSSPISGQFTQPSPTKSSQIDSGPAELPNDAVTPSFEVVSIKPNPLTGPYVMAILDGDLAHPSMKAVTVELLVERAFNVRDFQVSGGPKWTDSQRFDIEAKVDDATVAQMQAAPAQRIEIDQLMLQSMLADRFKLKVHHSTSEVPMYSLTVAKPGKLHPGKASCTPQALVPPPSPAMTPLAAEPGKWPATPCRGNFSLPGHLASHNMSMSDLASSLAIFTGKTVVDNTGLSGTYDVDLNWAPNPGQTLTPPPADSPFRNLPQPDPNGPSLQEALDEQFGLKLVSTTGPVGTIVIDHIEQPSPN